jgi:hypothetical protein
MIITKDITGLTSSCRITYELERALILPSEGGTEEEYLTQGFSCSKIPPSLQDE